MGYFDKIITYIQYMHNLFLSERSVLGKILKITRRMGKTLENLEIGRNSMQEKRGAMEWK